MVNRVRAALQSLMGMVHLADVAQHLVRQFGQRLIAGEGAPVLAFRHFVWKQARSTQRSRHGRGGLGGIGGTFMHATMKALFAMKAKR